jgi:hypothetical protein
VAQAGSLAKLRALIDAHREKCPNDPWLWLYSGELKTKSRDYDGADKDFVAGMKMPVEDEVLRNRFRSSRVFARFKAGKALEAYEQIGPRKQTFDQLTELLADENDAACLQELVSAHRKQSPDDADLPRWQAEVHWLKKEYAPCAELLLKNQELLAENYQLREHLIRSLIRLKRFDEAVVEAEKPKVGGFHRLIAHACAGNVARVETDVEQLTKEGFSPASFYADPDLGPALRGDKFRALREKYPEPEVKQPEK